MELNKLLLLQTNLCLTIFYLNSLSFYTLHVHCG